MAGGRRCSMISAAPEKSLLVETHVVSARETFQESIPPTLQDRRWNERDARVIREQSRM